MRYLTATLVALAIYLITAASAEWFAWTYCLSPNPTPFGRTPPLQLRRAINTYTTPLHWLSDHSPTIRSAWQQYGLWLSNYQPSEYDPPPRWNANP